MCLVATAFTHTYVSSIHTQKRTLFSLSLRNKSCAITPSDFILFAGCIPQKINCSSRLFPELLTESKCSSAPTIPSFKLQPLPEPRAEHSPYVNSAVPITSNWYKVVRFGARRVPREGGKSQDR